MNSRPACPVPVVVCLALGVVPLLAACGAGPDAVAQRQYAPSDGLLATVGDLRVQNVLVVAPPDGQDTAVLSMAVAETGGEEDDRLVDVSYEGGSATIEGEDEVPAGGQILVGGEDADAMVLLENFDADTGGTIDLTLRFARAGEVSLQPPVYGPTGFYEDVVAPVSPTPQPGDDLGTPQPGLPAEPDATPASPGAGEATPGGAGTPAPGAGPQPTPTG